MASFIGPASKNTNEKTSKKKVATKEKSHGLSDDFGGHPAILLFPSRSSSIYRRGH
jgi:hypothetical protein